jgi:hypothetical protein
MAISWSFAPAECLLCHPDGYFYDSTYHNNNPGTSLSYCNAHTTADVDANHYTNFHACLAGLILRAHPGYYH